MEIIAFLGRLNIGIHRKATTKNPNGNASIPGQNNYLYYFFYFIVFNVTFNNISVISWG
jgi:hypothetical protein